MVTAHEISARLRQVALSGISLDAFDEWLSGASWDMHKDSDPAAIKMVGEIERLFAEYERGLISEKNLLQHFQRLSGYFPFSIGDAPTVTPAGNTTHCQTIQFGWTADADRKFSAEFSCTPHSRG